MKAPEGARIIGIALDAFDGSDESKQITVYLEPGTNARTNTASDGWKAAYDELRSALKADNDNLRAELNEANGNYEELRREVDALQDARRSAEVGDGF